MFALTTPSSILLGAVLALFSHQCFAAYFLSSEKDAPKRIIKKFYRAEMLKWLLTASAFLLIFKFVNVAALPFFLSYFVMQILIGFKGLWYRKL